MNKTAIKNFAIWARRKLISDITYRAGMPAQQTAYLMNVSKHQILEMIRRKELRAFKISNKYMVPAEAIHGFIRQRLEEEMGILPDDGCCKAPETV